MRATPGMPAGQSAGASQRGRNALGRGLLVSVAENGRCLRDQLSCSLRGVRRPPKTGRQASVSEQRPSGGDYAVGLGQDRPLQSGLISDEGVGRAKSGNRRVEV